MKNDGYPASLEVRKVYRSLPDPVAASRGFVRVVDESGEDYLYPSECFVAVDCLSPRPCRSPGVSA